MRLVTIDETSSDQRLDRYLKKLFKLQSANSVNKWIRKKIIKVNGAKVSPDYKLVLGDEVQIYLPDELFKREKIADEKKKRRIKTSGKNKLEIVHEDSEILVVNKPKALLVHPADGEYKDALSTYVQAYLYDKISPTFSPASVSRLDYNTEGLVLFCKTYESLKKYNQLMRDRKIGKYYLTICEGRIADAITVQGYIIKDERANRAEFVSAKAPAAKKVSCEVLPLSYAAGGGADAPAPLSGGYTLAEVLLHTGRTHQIRASLAHIGHPVIGDKKYGAKPVRGLDSHTLTAYKLLLPDRTVEIEAVNVMKVWDRISKMGR